MTGCISKDGGLELLLEHKCLKRFPWVWFPLAYQSLLKSASLEQQVRAVTVPLPLLMQTCYSCCALCVPEDMSGNLHLQMIRFIHINKLARDPLCYVFSFLSPMLSESLLQNEDSASVSREQPVEASFWAVQADSRGWLCPWPWPSNKEKLGVSTSILEAVYLPRQII